MGGGRLSWAVRILAVFIAAEFVASGAVLVLHPAPARSAALVRSVPAPTTTTTVAPDPTTLPPPPSTSPPSTARHAPPPPTLPPDPVARLTARLEAALGGVPSALTVNGGLDHWTPSEVVTADPTALAGAQLTRLLVARGVSAAPGPSQVRPGNGVALARVTSAPLSDLVASMLRTSDNLSAELL